MTERKAAAIGVLVVALEEGRLDDREYFNEEKATRYWLERLDALATVMSENSLTEALSRSYNSRAQ